MGVDPIDAVADIVVHRRQQFLTVGIAGPIRPAQLDRRDQTPAQRRMVFFDQQRQRFVGQIAGQSSDQSFADDVDQRTQGDQQQHRSGGHRHFRAAQPHRCVIQTEPDPKPRQHDDRGQDQRIQPNVAANRRPQTFE